MGKGFIKYSLIMQSVPFVSKGDPKGWAFSRDQPDLKANPPFLSSSTWVVLCYRNTTLNLGNAETTIFRNKKVIWS